jgi:hypothetical protein
MNRMRNIGIASVAALLAASATAFAHHGWTGYEQDIQKISGTIEQPSYMNPHGSVRLKTADKTWTVVLAPPTRMEARGLTREMLRAGATATAEGYQHKTDTGEMRAERITIDGKTVELR